ncbi:PAS domain-containing protein [Mesorhizobium sp. WSM4312]|uniref:PAS domain-containing protein n=1 Tax=Mesorhizobium sp. WSM4312 TaxID=2029411 RepID=UPI0015C89309|nr:PAS domain-containing protein [Mesorhizobium sp. WSM4312]
MESELSHVVDALPGLVWATLPDGHTDFVNRRWCDYTGLSLEQASSQGWQAVLHPDDAPRFVEGWDAIVASGSPGELEARLRRVDGVFRWFNVRTCPLVNANGETVKWCGINTDIEDRKCVEEAFRVEENRFRVIVDGLPAIVTLMSADGQFEHANQYMLDYIGVTLEDMKRKDRPLGKAFHPDDRPAILVKWMECVRTGEPYDYEARLCRADGEYRWFHTQGFPLRDVNGKIVLWYLLQTDIDDRKRAEALLSGEKSLLEMVASGSPLPGVLDELCVLLDKMANGCVSGVLLLDRAGLKVERSIGPGLPATYSKALEGKTVSPEAGPCGMAVCQKIQVIVSDVATDARWDQTGWQTLALAHGLKSCWSTPIIAATGEALGTFAIYRPDGGLPTTFHQSLMQKLTHVASIAVARTHSEDDRQRAETLLAHEKRLLEMVAWGHTLPLVLDALCRLVEEMASGCHCGILFYSADETTWQHGAGPALPSGYNETMHGRPAHRASGPCGLAAFEKKQVIVSDIAADLQWDKHGWRTLALSHGIKACWSSPILSHDQKALGALAFYQYEPGLPTAFQRELIAQLSQIASIAVERARSESALKRSEAFLSKAQQLSSTGSFSWRVGTSDITWSEQAHRIFEFEHRVPVTIELLGSRIHPDDLELLSETIDRARSDGSDFEYECRLLMPDRSVKYLDVVAHGTRDHDGRLEYIGAVQDVTERRRSEEALGKVRSELAHVARATTLGALTASIAHEVNQPLSGIITNASTCLRMLAADPPNVDGARETARRTLRDGKRASDVIVRLRALFAKNNALTDSVDLNEATREIIALSSSDLQRNRVTLRAELRDDIPPVTGDRVQLQQVVLNLLLNASDAMKGVNDRPRQLLIRTDRDDGEHVRLTVQDTGVGFEPHVAERLFDAFYTTKTSGMGIGLSVSRHIIESHQGRLWAAPNEGPGATFSFSIPRKSEHLSDGDRLGYISANAEILQAMRND